MVRQWRVVAILLVTLMIGCVQPRSVTAGPARGRAAAANLLPERALLDGYTQLYQQHALSCEAAAVSMATQGLISESSIVAAMPVNSDPWLGFRGRFDAYGTLASGLANYGIYAPPLAGEMQGFGYQTAVISGTDAPALLRYSVGVLQLPVVVWVTYRLRHDPVIDAQADGNSFRLVRGEHARLVIGYDAAGVYSLDPVDGPRHDPWTAFLASWGMFDRMGLIVAPTFRRADPPPLSAQVWNHAATWSWPQPAWPFADEVTIYRAGQPLHHVLLTPSLADPGAASHPPLPPAQADDLQASGGESLHVMPLDAATPLADYLEASALLTDARPLTGTMSLTLQVTPNVPYTLTVSAVDPLGVVSPAAVSAPVIDAPPAAAPTDAPIFPPASSFVLPPDIAGGSTAIVRLRPHDLGSPTKPLSRAEYDIAAARLSYRVEVFASALDAQASFSWQMAHPAAGIRWLPAPATPAGTRLYTVDSYVVAAVLYRNVEFAVSMPATSDGAATLRTIDMARALVEQSSALAAAVAQPDDAGPATIVPPPATFTFPDLGAYRVAGVAHAAQGERVYDYSFRPRGATGSATRDYHALIEPSAARAEALAAQAVQTFTASYAAVGFRHLDLSGTPLADPARHAWAAEVPSLRCAVWLVFSYRNAWFLVTGGAGEGCSAGAQESVALGARLLQSAQAYVATRQG